MRVAVGAALIATLGLAACADNGSHAAAGVCKPFAAANAPAPTEPQAIVDNCLHRWAYALAKAEDGADTVATAVASACAAPLSRWNQQAVEGPTEAPSLLTGEPTTPIAAHGRFVADRALLYVVQARAGNCPAPKIETKDVTP